VFQTQYKERLNESIINSIRFTFNFFFVLGKEWE
jgi:hypothetical protein